MLGLLPKQRVEAFCQNLSGGFYPAPLFVLLSLKAKDNFSHDYAFSLTEDLESLSVGLAWCNQAKSPPMGEC